MPAQHDHAFWSRAMHQLARDMGLEAAYPLSLEGRMAALQRRLAVMEEDRWWFYDVRRTMVLRALRNVRVALAVLQREAMGSDYGSDARRQAACKGCG
jgi:hypothetical protein